MERETIDNNIALRINYDHSQLHKQNNNLKKKTILWQTIFANTAERKVPVSRV